MTDLEPLRALIVEDSEDDAQILVRTLSRDGFDVVSRRVETLEDLVDALKAEVWDIVISDYVLPGFDGLRAIASVRQHDPDLPCIVVSGRMGEDIAVEVMRAGANDYLMKDRLGRLGPVVRREIADGRARHERRAMQAAIARERELHAIVLRCIADGVVATDTEGRITLMNRVAETLSGWRLDQARGRHLLEVFPTRHPRSGEAMPDPVPAVVQNGQAPRTFPHEVLTARDGTQRLVAITSSPVRDEASRIIGAVFAYRDVTERRRLEQEGLRAQKLESLGVLAGGIAHDFNNILTGVLGNISLAASVVAENEPIRARLLEAEQALVRARDLTRQLLTFARGGLPVKQTAAIRDLIVDSAQFVLRGSRSQCEFSIPEDLAPVDVDVGQFSQVIQNLVLNADQAMPDGGVIRIRAENVRGPDGRPRSVRVFLADTGVGIPESHLERIFDPYFTTKPGGTGLGLATSYSIVRNHGGTITVESRVGSGSTFCIEIPVAAGHPVQVERPPTTRTSGHGRRVLVMDDEPLVLSVARQILKHLGYEVETASDGAEALRVFQNARESGRPFDVVIVDLTVPGGIGGIETLEALKRVDPAVRVVVSSGYSSDPIMADYARHGFCGVVAKPYTVSELNRAISEAVQQCS